MHTHIYKAFGSFVTTYECVCDTLFLRKKDRRKAHKEDRKKECVRANLTAYSRLKKCFTHTYTTHFVPYFIRHSIRTKLRPSKDGNLIIKPDRGFG